MNKEEQKPAEVTEVKTEVTEEQSEETKKLNEKIEQLEKDKVSLVGESKDLRTSRQEKDVEIQILKDQLEEKSEKDNPENKDMDSAIEKALIRREADKAKTNKVTALDQFISSNKEYSEENDPTGLKKEALEKEFNSFNLSDLTEVSQFDAILKKANTLLGRGDTTTSPDEEEENSPTPGSTEQPKAEIKEGDVTEEEQKLIERSGMTVERFLKLKESDPTFIESLLG